MPRLAFALLVSVTTGLLVLAGCGSGSSGASGEAPVLPGRWTGPDSTHFVFEDDSTALWVFGFTSPPDSFRIRYTFDPQPTPAHLDLYGFDRGFLSGRTLYCLLAFEGADTFEMDCEPGDPGDAAVRPDSLSRQTQIYTRQAG